MYPNPSCSDLKLLMPETLTAKAVTIEVYSNTGLKVLSYDVVIDSMNSPLDLNISKLENGSYFVKVSGGDGIVMKKVLIKQ